MSNGQKDTIYIDIDDEITAVIDKVRSAQHKIVALVLPKRAAVFQSIVNMKLLKRTGDEAKKQIVLITAEVGLMPLAGAVGLYVAKTLQSKPELPTPPGSHQVPADEGSDEDVPLDTKKPVGELAGMPDEDEEIEVDNSEDKTSAASKAKTTKPKKDRKLKIPNFDKFRKRIILAVVGGVGLIVAIIFGVIVLPKATVTIKTDTSNIDTDLGFVADPKATQLDQEGGIIPALSKEFRKTDTEKVAATGQKDLGTKASGSVSLKNCTRSDSDVTVPAGTTLSSSNLAYVTTEVARLPASRFSGGDSCITAPLGIGVVAASPGEKYNISGGQTFTVAGFSSVSGVDSTAMTGGISKIVKIISQQDVDSAKQKITDRNNSDASEEFKKEFEEESFMALTETLSSGNPTVSSTPNVGDEAAEVTVTSTVVSTMLGVKKEDLKTFVEEDAKKKIDQNTQMIIDNGLSDVKPVVTQKQPNGKMTMAVRLIVVTGPKLDDEAIKSEIVGKKRGEAQDIIRKRPGIKDVEVAYSPFWVQKTPKSTKKIKIVFEQTNNTQDNKD